MEKINFKYGGQGMIHSGKRPIESEIVFAPYIPTVNTPEFIPKASLSSRYGMKILNNGYYGTIDMNSQDESRIGLASDEFTQRRSELLRDMMNVDESHMLSTDYIIKNILNLPTGV